MTITVLTSISGAPGVSTTALGLALHWPDSSLLVDADVQQTFLAGYLGAQYQTDNGLTNVINAARITPDVREAVWRQSVPLPDDDPEGNRRLLLPGLTSGQTSAALHQSWSPIAQAFRSLGEAGVDVVVDYGRLTWSGMPPALLEVAHRVLVLTRPNLPSVGAARWGTQRLYDQALEVGYPTQFGILLVRRPALTLPAKRRGTPEPPERAFSDAEIGRVLPFGVYGTIPFDPVQAALLSEGGERGTKYARSRYAHALTRLAQALKGRQPRTPAEDTNDAVEETVA